MSLAARHLRIIGKNDHWETPPDIFREFCREHGLNPVLDVCATEQNTKCPSWYNRTGLAYMWAHDFFCNPPYSQVAKWVARGVNMVRWWKVTGLFLTFSKTDTKWWHKYVEGRPNVEVHFIKGRVRFWANGRPGKNCAPYPSCWIIMRPT